MDSRDFPEVAFASDTDGSCSSSSDESETSSHQREETINEDIESKKGKSSIHLRLLKRCKVCHRQGHEAGFKGATYVDCPMKPCFLCKTPGHTTISCPYRPVNDVAPLKRNTGTSLDYVFARQITSKLTRIKPSYVVPNKLICGAMKYHSRRVTCLEFHPTKNNILLSADKKGQIGVWDFNLVHEKTVYSNIHSCIVSNIRFGTKNDCIAYSASSDGTAMCTDVDTGVPTRLLNLNPNGWEGRNSWKMLYGMDVNPETGVLYTGDCFGYLHAVDVRANANVISGLLIHKKGSKVVGLHCNPVEPFYLLSCGNDHLARIWDVRMLDGSLCDLQHKRVVNSAYFSPVTGNKIITTCQDNRIRVWDCIFSNMESPSREIVHSHDFHRYLTPFRAEWDPKDHSESIAVIGRFISENYNGRALHPIDFIDVSTGNLIAVVMDPNIETISSVNKLHPRDDVLATGSSRSLLIWRPKEEIDRAEDKGKRAVLFHPAVEKNRKRKKNCDSDSDSDDDDLKVASKKNKKNLKFNV